MLIEIHAIQNHSPANLNRDDLGAPKTCFFGGVMRSRISSQCIKRSIRTSEQFKLLCGGIRTRQLAKLIADKIDGKAAVKKRAAKILEQCGIKPKDENKSDMLVYTSHEAIDRIARLLQDTEGETDQLASKCGKLISELVAVPDMALSGRMLETGILVDTTVDASLQVAHAISTHEARPEVDYYVAADDIPGSDAGAGYVDEAVFASACFYKYFSIHWETLVENLKGFQGNKEHLAAHTIGAFLRGAALANPSGKQNSFAAHNPPDGIVVEVKKDGCTPISYANAFACPVPSNGPPCTDGTPYDIVRQSIAQMGKCMHDLDTGYGKPSQRFWFSPNLRYLLTVHDGKQEVTLADSNFKSLDDLVKEVVRAIGFDWSQVQTVVAN
jgi:CRISPR system Cascade subunit CasC